MTNSNGLVAAVSAAVVDSDTEHRRLLQSVVEVARSIFGAEASSIFLLDEPSGELIFEAVAGAGEDELVGRRFPADRGIAGWVLATREPVVASDLSANGQFDRDLADSTRYVPDALMATPLLDGEEVLGVLEVLDPSRRQSALGELDLLTLFGEQAAIALRVVQRSRAARRVLGSDGGDFVDVVSLVQAFDRAAADRRTAGLSLLRSVYTLLDATP